MIIKPILDTQKHQLEPGCDWLWPVVCILLALSLAVVGGC